MKNFLNILAGAAIVAVVLSVFPPAEKAKAYTSGYRRAYSFDFTATTTSTEVAESGVATYYDAIRCKPAAAGTVYLGSETRIEYSVGDCTYCDAQLTVPTRSLFAKAASGTVAMECMGLIK